ncbi:hypothetical protein TIFTF001_038711 [Ficus carica]|uniref:Uncharacterized protein n=1 Tax=Ficus carica TaxID=3494 RepID=A0AA88JD72_FICCA|nr:hypothetical protein TIFTF001_038711 [Ficus carica]
MWWPAMLNQTSQVSKARGLLIKARSMTCPFLVVAGHMWRVKHVLASQNHCGGRPIGPCGGTLLVQAQHLAK